MSAATAPDWIAAIGGAVAGLAAPGVAIFALLTQRNSNREERARQEREHQAELDRREQAARTAAAEARRLAASERLWSKRVSTYVLAISYLQNWQTGVELLVREYGLIDLAEHYAVADIAVARLTAELSGYGSSSVRSLWLQAKQTLADEDVNAALTQMRQELEADYIAEPSR